MIGNCGSNTKIAVLDFVFGSLNHFREHMYFNCASFADSDTNVADPPPGAPAAIPSFVAVVSMNVNLSNPN